MTGDGEIAAVDLVVVETAQQDAVVDGRRSVVALPPVDVMDLAPAGVRVTLGPPALAIASDHAPLVVTYDV